MKLGVAFFFVIMSFAAAARTNEQSNRFPQNRRIRQHDTFIVGGTPATIEQYPHMLAIINMSWGGTGWFGCGASVIS